MPIGAVRLANFSSFEEPPRIPTTRPGLPPVSRKMASVLELLRRQPGPPRIPNTRIPLESFTPPGWVSGGRDARPESGPQARHRFSVAFILFALMRLQFVFFSQDQTG